MEPTTRASLVLRLRDPEDGAAWAEFVEIYEPLIYRLAARKGFQHADAQDLLQDVLVAIRHCSGVLERKPGFVDLFRNHVNLLPTAVRANEGQAQPGILDG